ncbi:choice-of-anchor H family protein [Paraglaciecola sp. MB-3u-78]|uniref:choice-of-anchor H family protein n=1 Tax=Paraglaciecola sp. MB-3u-78 TaxID=2058332 RepID=UPI000C341F0C|nr:choice-of-anchor H family protein [Paraglaciecola sp. MB-3u-78]PKG98710.1 GlyGly-CTERM sorting domain-containing protein [Paraglaciecola sp. MB-3u-78]
MKNSSLLLLSGVFLSSVAWGTENESWRAQSTEKQFELTSGVMYKSSKDDHTNVLSVTPSAQSKGATSANNTKHEQARILTLRPEAKVFNQEFWIFDAWVEFYSDTDRDGYFNHFSVEFDADTQFSSAKVYARLYLGKDEVFKEYHTTSNFDIFSDNSDDSFVVESELLNGFSSAEYEVLIELYDAYSDELVAVFDGNDDADLYLLSLESKEYESTQVIIVREHGGSVSLWGLLLLPVLLITRQYRKS